MALIPDRSTLESLRRADLQKLCKDHGLKANMKSEQLIDLLLDTAQANPAARMTRRSTSVRIASRDSTDADARGRVGSMIIHDLSEDEGGHGGHDLREHGESSAATNGGPSRTVATDPSPPSGPATRTRKAKDTLYKLGVGRPKALGGTGARKLSRGPPSGFSARGKRVNASVSIQPSHESIQEEEEEGAGASHMAIVDEPMPEAGPSGTTHDSPPPQLPPPSQQVQNSTVQLQTMISEAVDPLRNELERLRSELQHLTSLTGDPNSLTTTVTQLAAEVAALRLRSHEADELEQEVKSLKDEIATLKSSHFDNGHRSRSESSGKATEHSVSHTAIASSSLVDSNGDVSPSPPKTTLGKRQRESAESPISGVVDSAQAGALSEEELAKQIVRPTRKRPKLVQREASGEPLSSEATEAIVVDTELVDDDDLPMQPPVPRGPSFTIFSGPEEPPDEGPPTTRLSDVFGHGAVTPPNGQIATATASASENQPPSTGGAFNFNFATSIFQPATTTPTPGPPPSQAYSAFPVSIPAPEPPTSPTPAGPAAGRLSVAPGTRPPRPHSAASRPASRATQRQTSQPAAGSSSSMAETIARAPVLPSIVESSAQGQTQTTHVNPAHMGLGMSMGLPGYVPLPVAPDTPAPPMKRTMYGTELETDTRFGDFGVEGVATGFWTGAAPRF